MLPDDHPDRIQIAFDDHRLVNNAGLILPSTLARHLGLPQLVEQRLDLGNAPGRANPGGKMMTLVASALAGGDRASMHLIPPFRRRPVRWIRAKNSGEYGSLRTSVRRAINGSNSPRGRSTVQESLLRWRRKLESGWRRELPTKLIYVTAIMRSKSGIINSDGSTNYIVRRPNIVTPNQRHKLWTDSCTS